MPSWLDAWHVNPSANRDYDFIDGLRGIAILMVVCCHGIYVNPNAGPSTKVAAPPNMALSNLALLPRAL
jgi:peptidoglycan/LPS O-acetylase OafA/YrhL